MLKPIFAFLFVFGLVLNASPVLAAVEAVVSGNGTVMGPLAAQSAAEDSSLSVSADASEMVPDAPESRSQPGIDFPSSAFSSSPHFSAAQESEAVLASNEGETSVQVISSQASESVHPEHRLALIPMMGVSGWTGRWNQHVTNSLAYGLILEAPISRNFSLEIEGSYAQYNISYSSFGHNFDLYGLGGNGKIYLARGTFSPFIGAGLMGLYFDNMSRGPSYPYQGYNHWLGSLQLMAGGDIALSRDISLGLRGAYVRPLFNQPATFTSGYYTNAGFEESAAINSAFFRLMGAVRIAL